MAKTFGSTKVKFHGRTRELAVLKEIYNEVRMRGAPPSNSNPDQTEEKSEHTQATTSSLSPDDRGGKPSSLPKIILPDKEPPAVKRSVAFVAGISGSGKSALVTQFIEDLKDQQRQNETSRAPLFLSGKFEELAGADPFSAVVEAFAGLTSLLLDNGEYTEDLARIQKDVKACLGQEDVAVLTNVVPVLNKILSDKATKHGSGSRNGEASKNTEENNEASTQNSWNRLKYVLQLFTKTIATRKRPIVLFLDDLQWADNGSLELLQVLVTDKRIRNFMFIGNYRSDEVVKNHPLIQRIDTIRKIQPVEHIHVGNFSVDELIGFLNHHIKIDPSECQILARKVHATTKGNMFFVVQILVELNQQCALIYSEFTKGWEWDDVAGMLVLETGLSDNLEEAVEMKIKRCPRLIRKALVTMAYSRSTIDFKSLFKLMETNNRSRSPLESNNLSKALDRAVLEGFLSNNIGSNYYSFAHDKVMQASYALIPKGKSRERFRLRMGRRLYAIGSSNAGETWMLFAAAEHLNSSLSLTETDPFFLARMNLDIGERASKISAYDQASKCLVAGLDAIMMIPDFDPWAEEYDLTLRLHRAVADVELCLGNFESGSEVGRRLLGNSLSLDDKLPTYESLAIALGREELHSEAVDMNRDAMIRLGAYPKRNRIVHLAKELIVIMRYLKKTSDSDMMNLPVMTDKSKENALAFSRGLTIQAFYCDNQIEYLLGTLRALQITFQYGLSGYSALAIVGYGFVQSTALNDHAGALRGVRLARNIISKCEAKSQESVFRFCAAHFIEGWGDPHEKTLEAYRQGHLIGMEVGNVEDAFLNSFAAVHHARAAGSPLGSIEVITRELLDQMNLYNVKSILVLMEQCHLPVQYLTGTHQSSEPDWEELGVEPKSTRRTGSENLRLLFWYIGRVELGVYFGNFEFADRMAKKLRSILPLHFAFVPLSFRLFYSGLAASRMARQMRLAGKRMQAIMYHAKARRYCRRLGHLNRANGSNSYHRELLLLADLNLSGKEDKPVSYDRAINACLEAGHIHDAALGSELAGENYLTNDNSKKGTVASNTRNKLIRRHFTRARDLYHQWGAYGKVEHLQKTRGDNIDGRHTECENSRIENGGIVSIELEDDFSRNSSENDLVSDPGAPVMHNPTLLKLLAGIVPSSRAKDILSSIPDNELVEEQELISCNDSMGSDEFSIVSDMD